MSQAPAGSILLSEIMEQPAAVQRTLRDAVDRFGDLRRLAGDATHIMLLGRGSSRAAAIFGVEALREIAGVSAYAASPAAVAEPDSYARTPWSETLVVAISQSGESIELIEAVRALRPKTAGVAALTADPNSTLAQIVGDPGVMQLGSGIERAVPATKSYTAMIAALLALTYAVADETDELTRVEAEIPTLMEQVLEPQLQLDLHGLDQFIIAGEGFGFGVAEEAAIKLRETLRASVIATETSELLHGNINSATGNVGVITLAVDRLSRKLSRQALSGAAERGASTFSIGFRAEEAAGGSVVLPEAPAPWSPFLTILPLQLTARSSALAAGLNPDSPDGLSKVTRVEL